MKNINKDWNIADDVIRSAVDNEEIRSHLAFAVRITALENELNQKYKTIKRSYYQTINSFEKIMGSFNDALGKHCRRVGYFALALAKNHTDIKAEDYPLIEAAGRLHDIGFIGLTPDLFGKDRVEMNGDQISQYRNHPERGEGILSQVDLLKPVSIIVRQHHEQPNGRGFPDGLTDQKIVLAAQIVNAASIYDHLANVKQLSDKHITENLQKLRGYQIAPEMVDMLLDLHLLEVQKKEKQNEISIPLEQLDEGMVLSRDVLMRSGAFCMAAGQKLDHRAIEKLKHYFELGNIGDGVFISK